MEWYDYIDKDCSACPTNFRSVAMYAIRDITQHLTEIRQRLRAEGENPGNKMVTQAYFYNKINRNLNRELGLWSINKFKIK